LAGWAHISYYDQFKKKEKCFLLNMGVMGKKTAGENAIDPIGPFPAH